MKKLLYNTSYGGFGFSVEFLKHFGITDEKYSDKSYAFNMDKSNRTNPEVIALVEKMGLEKASGSGCRLAILIIGDDDIYEIEEYDGLENPKLICRAKNNLVY